DHPSRAQQEQSEQQPPQVEDSAVRRRREIEALRENDHDPTQEDAIAHAPDFQPSSTRTNANEREEPTRHLHA
ncbi:unnamed protein product, partial [Amoebophrya sp. A25]